MMVVNFDILNLWHHQFKKTLSKINEKFLFQKKLKK